MLSIEFKTVGHDWKFINNSLVREGGEGKNRQHLGFVEQSNFITVEIKDNFSHGVSYLYDGPSNLIERWYGEVSEIQKYWGNIPNYD